MKKLFLLLLFCLVAIPAFAQYNSPYSGAQLDTTIKYVLIEGMKAKVTQHTKQISSIFDQVEIDTVNNKTILKGDSVGVRGNLDLDGSLILRSAINISNTELSYLDGVTSSIQTQLNNKLSLPDTTGIPVGYIPKRMPDGSVQWRPDSVGVGGSGIQNLVEDTTPQLGGALDLNGQNITNTSPSLTLTPTEMSYLDGVTSNIQTQFTGKQNADADLDDLADGSLTGSKVGTGINASNITSGTLADGQIASSIHRDSETKDGDLVSFDDTDNNFTATNVDDALSELDDVINGGFPNAATGKVDWSQLTNVPGGFSDNTDDGGGSVSWGSITGTLSSQTDLQNALNAKLESSDIQLFIDTLYRSNDTIYFVQKDGSTLYFVDTGGDISAYWDSTAVKNYVAQQTGSDTISYPAEALDSLMIGLDGGTTGQVPRKKSNARFDFEFYTPSGTGTFDTTHIYIVLDSLGALITQISQGDTSQYTVAQLDSLLGLAGTAVQPEDLSGNLTVAQETQLNMLWAYHAPLDTTAADPNIPDSSDAGLSTVIWSDSTAITSLDVGRFYNITSSEFRLFHPVSGWTAWYNNTASNPLFSRASAIQVRDTSSASNSDTTLHIFYTSGVVDTFIIITEAVLINAPTNVDAINWTVAGGGGSSIDMDSLQHYFVLDSLDEGDVIYWYDAIRNYSIAANLDTIYEPIKTGNSLIFDGNDFLRGTGTGLFPLTSGAMSFYIVMTFEAADTAAGSFSIAGMRYGNYALTLGMHSNNRITVYGFNGSPAPFGNYYSTPFVGTHVIAVTWDGNSSNVPIVYVDGVAQPDIGDAEGLVNGEARIMLGGEGVGATVPAGTSLPLLMIYNITHDATQVGNNTTAIEALGLD